MAYEKTSISDLQVGDTLMLVPGIPLGTVVDFGGYREEQGASYRLVQLRTKRGVEHYEFPATDSYVTEKG